MKINEIVTEAMDMTPEQKKLANLGRILMDMAITTKDDALSNVMSRVGDELTRYGASWGARSMKELVAKTKTSEKVIMQMMSVANKKLEKDGPTRPNVKDPVPEPEMDDI
jgi:predicted component of type VI protein secretion system